MSRAGPLFPKKVLIGIQEGRCNLKCPKCYVYGTNRPSQNARPPGIMDPGLFGKIIGECEPHGPRIAPQTWDEPLMNPGFFDYVAVAKRHGLRLTMDTNGLLLNERNIRSLVELQVDSVFISIDAFTSDVLRKTRGIGNIEKIVNNVHALLRARGESKFPRVGVSFVLEEQNRHEELAFVDYWTRHVDVVRVNHRFERDRTIAPVPEGRRTACWSLWDSLMIHPNGDVALCCVDTHYETRIGNVEEQSISEIWNGFFFRKAREAHLKGDWGALSVCRDCMLWSNERPVEERRGGLHISRTSTHSYYNRVDRLDNMIPGNRYVTLSSSESRP